MRHATSAAINAISEHTGSTPEEMHEEMKVRFLGAQHIEVAGSHLIVPMSTTKLTTKEFTTQILEPLEALAVTLDIALPIPDDCNDAMAISVPRNPMKVLLEGSKPTADQIEMCRHLWARLYEAMDFRVASFCPALQSCCREIMAPEIVEIPA